MIYLNDIQKRVYENHEARKLTNLKGEKKMRQKIKRILNIGDTVIVLRGNYKNKIGQVIDKDWNFDQVDVKMANGKIRHLGFDDIEIVCRAYYSRTLKKYVIIPKD